jgi:Ca2+-binding RTX toxin-like protein
MAIIKGTNAAETKTGTSGIDTIYGYDGNDSLYGRAGNDTIWAGNGNDKVWGEDGDDLLRGEAGDDFIYSGNGNDTVYGGIGNDTLYGDGGTDKIYGDGGNDVIKGGTGISYLYGGDGSDQLFYDPTTDNIGKLGQYLSGSALDGGAGTDTLNIFNNSTYTLGAATKASYSAVWVDQNGTGHIRFMPAESTETGTGMVDAGTFTGIEKIVLTGSGGSSITSHGGYGTSLNAVGTSGVDHFQSLQGSDTFKGGAGNDEFRIGAGYDTVVSEANDSDVFYFEYDTGVSTITGFNGAGVAGGDVIHLCEYGDAGRSFNETTITEADGKTTFNTACTWGDNSIGIYTVDAVGLKEGIDYFFT